MADFIEMKRQEELAKKTSGIFRSQILSVVKDHKNQEYPIYAFELGTSDRTAPAFGIFAGVHGLEKIGTHVAIQHIEMLLKQIAWDEDLQKRFEHSRLVAIPMINPWGVHNYRRSNPNGVDLMRNGPIEAEAKPPFLVGGHRISPKLPWYRGPENAPLELEAQTFVDYVKKELFESQFSFALDIHSGFGARDRLWYPYAKTAEPFPLEHEALKFKALFEHSFPNHVYLVEQQAVSYTTHGDLWDYLFDEHYEQYKGKKIFMPWCLEMGSWMWIKKNPRQLFSLMGVFNPILPHRYKRIMRRHYFLLDFFLRSAASYKNWI